MRKVPTSQYQVTAMLTRLNTPDLKAPEKLLLIVLSDYGNHKGEDINPSLTTLSQRSCMSRRAVIDNLRKLQNKGYIGRIKGGVFEGQLVTNRYFINMEKLGYSYRSGNLIS